MEGVGAFDERTKERGSIRGMLTKIELRLAYTSEKFLNLEMLLIHVIRKASDYETLARKTDEISIELVEKNIELDILSGILDSEVNELDYFISFLMRDILGVREKIYDDEYQEVSWEEIGEKLHGVEETVKQSQDHILEIKRQIDKFNKIVHLAEQETPNGDSAEHLQNRYFSSYGSKWKIQTVEMQRNNLQLLEKSLARELEIEKNMTDARRKEEEIKLSLHYAEQETYFMEETVQTLLGRLFEAENFTVVQTGVSQELVRKLETVQFDLNRSLSNESEMKFNLMLHEHDLQEALKAVEERSDIANSEAISLRVKVNSLEKQLHSCNILSQEAKASHETVVEQQNILNSELLDLENVILDLRDNLFKTDSRAENAEAKCILLTETNMELNEEMSYLKRNDSGKTFSLEMKLKESDARLEQAYTNIEALEEQKRLLTYSVSDMEDVVDKLKTKVFKTEKRAEMAEQVYKTDIEVLKRQKRLLTCSVIEMENVVNDLKTEVLKNTKRAESAESRCVQIIQNNIELNKSLSFLRHRLQTLEEDLYRTRNEKIDTANVINIKTQDILNLVMKLASKREHFHTKLSAIKKENKILTQKCCKIYDPTPTHNESNVSDGDFVGSELSNKEATHNESNVSDEDFVGSEPSNKEATQASSTNIKMESPVTHEAETDATSVQTDNDAVIDL